MEHHNSSHSFKLLAQVSFWRPNYHSNSAGAAPRTPLLGVSIFEIKNAKASVGNFVDCHLRRPRLFSKMRVEARSENEFSRCLTKSRRNINPPGLAGLGSVQKAVLLLLRLCSALEGKPGVVPPSNSGSLTPTRSTKSSSWKTMHLYGCSSGSTAAHVPAPSPAPLQG
jgi:hypothetical protein